jgi:hypothetical protein
VWIQFPWLVLHCAKAATEGAGASGVASKKTSQPYWTRKRVGDDPVVLADPLPTKTLLQVRVWPPLEGRLRVRASISRVCCAPSMPVSVPQSHACAVYPACQCLCLNVPRLLCTQHVMYPLVPLLSSGMHPCFLAAISSLSRSR